MPGAYVFPGGRVDPADRVPSGFPEPLAPAPHGADGRTRERLAVFARTALRECLEETGLLVAAANEVANGCRLIPTPAGPEEPAWRAYRRARAQPAFGALLLVGRAITPVSSPIRFHTRFFMALSPDGAPPATAPCGPDAELEDLLWVPVAEVERLPVPEANRLVLREALARAEGYSHARQTQSEARWPASRAGAAAPCFPGRGRAERLWRTPAEGYPLNDT